MFENLFGFLRKQKSGSIAKDRMQVLLAIDRTKTSVISEEVINNIKEEIMQVISKYLEIDMTSLDIKVERQTDESGRIVSAVVANIPINKSNNNFGISFAYILERSA